MRSSYLSYEMITFQVLQEIIKTLSSGSVSYLLKTGISLALVLSKPLNVPVSSKISTFQIHGTKGISKGKKVASDCDLNHTLVINPRLFSQRSLIYYIRHL